VSTTGEGEAIMRVVMAETAVEMMRAGMTPSAVGVRWGRRPVRHTVIAAIQAALHAVRVISVAILLVAFRAAAQDTVVVESGALRLRGLLWQPKGNGPFPAVLFNHGSGQQPMTNTIPIGDTFTRHGYVTLVLFRRGQGLSVRQGESATWSDARSQVRLLETEQLSDALAGLAYLRALPRVDARRVVIVGHSFGGALSLLMAERDSSLRAVIDFGGAAFSWSRAPELRARLLAAVNRTTVPTFFIHAVNDYSVAPGTVMDSVLAARGVPHRLRIYPAVGTSAEEGHAFVYLAIPTWEADVFAFLAADE
jgi:dienelactone hydrolase